MKFIRNKIFPIIIAILCLLVSIPCYGFDSQNSINTQYHITAEYSYSVTQWDEDWGELTDYERDAIKNIPESYYRNAITEVLFKAVVENPLTPNIFAFNTVDEGINILKLRIPALAELLQRDDFMQAANFFIDNNVFDIARASDKEIINYYIAISLRDYVRDSNATDYLVDPDTGWQMEFVRTPNNSAVLAYVGLTWADHNTTSALANSYTSYLISAYSATLISAADPSYNCHSYAWYSTSTSNDDWINDPSLYMTDGSYSEIQSPQNSCKITYKTGNDLSHSGVIVYESGTYYVYSKFGSCGVLKTTITNNCYYDLGATNVQYWQ